MRFPQEVIRTGQQHRDGAGSAHGDRIVFGHELQMISRQRLVPRREAGTVQGRQLLGVQFHRQTQFAGADKHLFDLRRREGQVFAERIHRIHQPFCGQGREHFAADVMNVVVGAVGVFRRQRVRRQASAAHGDGQHRAEPTDYPQQFALAGQIQTVAGFDFHGGHAVVQQTLEALFGAGEKLVFTGGPGRAHGAGDTATGRCDLCVAHAFEALFKLAAAVATEHGVGVAVDQAGGNPGAIQIDDAGVVITWQISLRTDPLYVLAGRHDGGVLDDRVSALRHACNVAVLPECFHCRPPRTSEILFKKLVQISIKHRSL